LRQLNINYEDIVVFDFIPVRRTQFSVDDMIDRILNDSYFTLGYLYDLDLVSQYNIYQRRLGCKIRDPNFHNFGKAKILDKLDRLYRNSTAWGENSLDIKIVLKCYLRLCMESIINDIKPLMVIPDETFMTYIPIPPLGEIFEDPQIIPKLLAEIDRLYKLIREKLELL